MIYIFLGAPGCGKGTQAKMLVSSLGIKHVAVGDLLREIAKSDTPVGKRVAAGLSSGNLVSPDIVNNAVSEYITNCGNDIILDGYPRSLEQAMFLENAGCKDFHIFYFEIDPVLLEKRITGRYSCKDCGAIYNKFFMQPKIEGVCDQCSSKEFVNRADDNAEVLLKRVDIFNMETKPLVDRYIALNKLTKIDAADSMEHTYAILEKYIKNT